MGSNDKVGGGGSRATSHLLVVGIVLWVVAWFVPVVRGQEIFGGIGNFAQSIGASPESSMNGLHGPDWLPGWSACQFAWSMLTGESAPDAGDWRQRLAGSSCLTNVVMLLAILAAITGSRSRLAGLLVLGCAGVNASWLYLAESDPFRPWAIGYWLWLASFVLVGLGLLFAPSRKG
jgi:hypothetical protein